MRKRTLVLAAPGLLLINSSALSQQSIVDHCRQSSTPADQIACLEAALLGRETVVPDTSPAVSPPPAPVPVPAQEAAPVGIGADQVVARNITREEQIQRLEVAEGLKVAAYDTVPYDKLLVTLENGQVWRQIKGDTQKIRVSLRRNQTVNITESSISGYKMRLNEMRRSLRVERIK